MLATYHALTDPVGAALDLYPAATGSRTELQVDPSFVRKWIRFRAPLKCWGYNGSGELGLGDRNNRGDGPNEMGANLGSVALGLPAEVTVAEISVGNFHTCALLSDGQVKCWGRNGGGQLGLGDMVDRGDEPDEVANLLPVKIGLGATITAIRTGGNHTCALLTGGSVKCWGANGGGQLGLFDTLNRGDGPNEMGDNLPIVDF